MDPNHPGSPPYPTQYPPAQAPYSQAPYPPGAYSPAQYPPAVAPIAATPAGRWVKVPSTIEIVGLIMAFAPFLVSISSGSIETENGRIVHYEYRDAVAILGG